MKDKSICNNQVFLVGKIEGVFAFDHQVLDETFFSAYIHVKRLSNFVDKIPVMISEYLIDESQDYEGKYVEICGSFQSFNYHEEKKTHLKLFVSIRKIKIIEGEIYNPLNSIYLDGYICKPVVYRKTPFGREIADLLLAVNRAYGKSDYIPCICWGENARFVSSFHVGGRVCICGRIQSREYVKETELSEEKRMAYEVSIGMLEYKY